MLCLKTAVLSLLLVGVFAAVPEDLSNYANFYVCDTRVRLIRPETVDDVVEAVKRYSNVQAAGEGQSWNQEFFCPVAKDAAVIVMTTIRPLIVDVDEDDMSVWVSAGVITWDLMVFLANYVTPNAPRGYALGSHPFFPNQTVAGGVSTGTHGSSFSAGSLSNQVVGFKVVLANGTKMEIYPDSHPLYFKAFQVNVGRLGVVTDVKMRIIKEDLMERTLVENIPIEEMMTTYKKIQEDFKATGKFPEGYDGAHTYFPSGLAVFFKSLHRVVQSAEDTPFDPDFADQSMTFAQDYLETKINAPFDLPRSEGDGDVADGVAWKPPTPFPQTPIILNPAINLAFSVDSNPLFAANKNATVETHLNYPISPTRRPEDDLLGNDIEVSVPLAKIADCWEGFLDLLAELQPDTGLRFPVVNRFVPKETGLLSVSNDQPMVYFDLPDYFLFNSAPPKKNAPLNKLIGYMVSSPNCSPARQHWGKSGWPDAGCWNGSQTYHDTWCDFGCVVRDLDPENKFEASASELWNWSGAMLDACCTPDGYDRSKEGCDCAVQPTRDQKDCPPPPFYSNR